MNRFSWKFLNSRYEIMRFEEGNSARNALFVSFHLLNRHHQYDKELIRFKFLLNEPILYKVVCVFPASAPYYLTTHSGPLHYHIQMLWIKESRRYCMTIKAAKRESGSRNKVQNAQTQNIHLAV